MQDSFKNPWKTDGVKAYALCPWFASTALVKESIEISEEVVELLDDTGC